jgi:hypothetical protein
MHYRHIKVSGQYLCSIFDTWTVLIFAAVYYLTTLSLVQNQGI